MNWKLLLLLYFPAVGLFAQENNKDLQVKKEMAEMDSISEDDLAIFDTIQLDDARLLHLNLNTEMEKKYYLWLRKRVRDVWPYVKVAVEEYNAIQDTSTYFQNKELEKSTSKIAKMY